MKYTVVLLYPSEIAGFEGESFLAHVDAKSKNPGEAVLDARQQLLKQNQPDENMRDYDFPVVAVFAGWLDDIKPEES
jgi:hypothetical protein